MQTALRITNGESGTSYYRRSRMYGCQPGDQPQKKKKTDARRSNNDFLMRRILPVAPDYYTENDQDGKINLTTKENFEYLYRSARKYAGLAGVELPFHKTKENPRINIINLYKAVDAIFPEHVNMETREEDFISAYTASTTGRTISYSGYRWISRRNFRKSSNELHWNLSAVSPSIMAYRMSLKRLIMKWPSIIWRVMEAIMKKPPPEK